MYNIAGNTSKWRNIMHGNTKWTNDKIDYLTANYKKFTNKELATRLSMSSGTIRKKYKELGLSKKSGYRPHFALKYETQEDYFETWSPNMAYLLGFITADGHLNISDCHNRLIIGLSQKDKCILDFVSDQISRRPYYINKNNNSIYLTINSKKLIKSIQAAGLPADKNNITVLQNMPKELWPHYLLGIFDGDGCFTYQQRVRFDKYKSVEGKFQITNNNLLLLNNLRDKCGFGYGKIYKSNHGNYYNWVICKTEELLIIYRYMYSQMSFCLNRKKNKFEEFLSLKGKI